MNITSVSFDEFHDLIAESKVLRVWDERSDLFGYAVEHCGEDLVIFFHARSATGIVIGGSNGAYGGSMHDHIRQGGRDATL
jgi:hypothetical protein